jgi:hypothetical protein
MLLGTWKLGGLLGLVARRSGYRGGRGSRRRKVDQGTRDEVQ